ncbi:metallophosphoesterase family protein [Acidisphaera rubrifaciens]|uniref:Metallophosphoesterase n=1 Tax=Acidisphaera rubrifaciens HS-AP3 TaxID=1231350 RepID=A0A0D6P8L2_9PROT|nr:metallophosphoesterase [Acidisphaera rubrifaciens]GAN77671.1 metallophosphoesterase [Acidisphaera rubrifaciens HS-AP3]
MPASDAVVTWLHFGDLHITVAQAENHRDFLALIDMANRHLAGAVDFAYLPGDNADGGTDAQFALVRACLDRLRIPTHVIPGDHDFATRRLDGFYRELGARPLPYATRVAGHRCLFLDIVSAGGGGLDFRLDGAQLDWLEAEVIDATAAGEGVALFMHAYPADLRAGGDRLRTLLARHHVACIDMGHTHYNELANDGRTIYAATRSIGQVEEGPPGFSVAAIDGGIVSWRFAPLGGGWPLVLITGPADHRLITRPAAHDQVLSGPWVDVRAKVWGATSVTRVTARLGAGDPLPLLPAPDDGTRWTGRLGLGGVADGLHRLTVRAEDAAGQAGEETITVLVDPAGRHLLRAPHADGSDRDAVGAWPEKHIAGTQLGPNRNGRAW